jgi:hypothetical protein
MSESYRESDGDARHLLGWCVAALEPLSDAELAEILNGSEEAILAIQARLPDFLRLHGRLHTDPRSLKAWLFEERSRLPGA